ncbi:MAG: flagellar basal-body rod protein FlgG [Chitinivibrionia bacterium]|nr:flagellar basal-body rod protein FlgG [Chitinivibrionia bacterium]
MVRSLHTGATGMKAQQLMIDTITNNLSNVNTNAYKRQRLHFKDLMYQTLREPGVYNPEGGMAPAGIEVGMGVRVSSIQRVFAQGSLIESRGGFDMAIAGEGFFQIELPNGEISYSRDGHFLRDSTGTLVTADGYRLFPEIIIPEGFDSIEVSLSGFVVAHKSGMGTVSGQPEEMELGQIELATFINPGGLRSLGSNLFAESSASGAPLISIPGEDNTGQIRHRMLEASNVEIVDEMVGMIQTQRAYEIVSRSISVSEEMLQTATNLKR